MSLSLEGCGWSIWLYTYKHTHTNISSQNFMSFYLLPPGSSFLMLSLFIVLISLDINCSSTFMMFRTTPAPPFEDQ